MKTKLSPIIERVAKVYDFVPDYDNDLKKWVVEGHSFYWSENPNASEDENVRDFLIDVKDYFICESY